MTTDRSGLPSRRECAGCHQLRGVGEFEPGGDRCAHCRLTAPVGEAVRRVEQEAAMKQECPWCHVAKSNLWEHEKVCPKRPGDGTPPERAPTRARRPREAQTLMPPAPPSNGQGDGWPFTAPAAEQDFFAQLVRDGLSLQAARDRVQQAKAVFVR